MAGTNETSRPKKHVARVSPGRPTLQPAPAKSQLPFDQSSDFLVDILPKLTASEQERNEDDLAVD
jgi:hypothetical protein